MLGAPGTGSWVSFLFSLFFFGFTTGKATNRTIDDQFGDSVTGQKPIFSPTTEGIWANETCAGCRFQPDKAVAFKGTWQAATFRPEPGGSGPLSIDLSFKGTAIYLFFITGNQIAGGIITTTLMECNFTLDGEHAGFYQHIPDKSEDFQYNVLGFNSTGLSNVDHTVRVTTEGVDYQPLLNFDYAIYTFDDTLDPITNTSTPSNTLPPPNPAAPSNTPPLIDPPTPSGTSSPNISGKNGNKTSLGAILGGTLGGLAAILGLIVLFYIYRDKKRRSKPSELTLHTNMATHHTVAP
ncbi:hypothetical protein BDZ94DRAFT_1202270 [Collybia nuda]|uniref:Uncharacterized protein n=1 Tax=Collybia nuda TaxID=64659 RepID=A0A9P5XU16_9AGAR|nr:hypothetical protein BDZ94DRAFT_1202270 [Collybia nuda]